MEARRHARAEHVGAGSLIFFLVLEPGNILQLVGSVSLVEPRGG